MKAEDTELWDFDRPPTEACKVECPDCETFSPLADWREGEVYCDLCGEHAAMVCPSCDARHDHVRSPTFRVEEAS